MNILTLFFMLSGITGSTLKTKSVAERVPVVKTVAQFAPSDSVSDINQTEPVLAPIVIDIQYQTGQRCVLAPTTQIIQRNLTLPYYQLTVYGTAQCQSDK